MIEGVIDSHHHFWRYNPAEFDWISDEMAALRRDFLPADLKAEMATAGVTGVVSVQARQTLEETRWLLEMANENDWILGVVGWVPLASSKVEAILENLIHVGKLKAVRHVVQGEASGFLEGADFNRGISLLRRFDLVYDLLIFESQLAEAIQFVNRHPDQLFVLDHIAKPRIKEGLFEPWKTQIIELARCENVSCKVSGMVTEADWQNWTPQSLKPYFDTVLDAFGTSRLLFGSDWPVCRVACDYSHWLSSVRGWVEPLLKDEQDDFFRNNARRVYNLNSR